MGGRIPHIANREIDKRNKRYLENLGDKCPYRFTLKNDYIVRPELVKNVIKNNFVRIPFPGENRVLWGFDTLEDLELFKKEFNNA